MHVRFPRFVIFCLSLFSLLSLLSTATLAQTAASCTFTLFDFGGDTGAQPSGVNRWGNVVGNSTAGPFIRFSDGRIQKLPFIGFVGKRNASGITVGSFSTSDNHTHGFIQNGTQRTVVDFPGATHTVLRGINRFGTVVGSASASGAFSVALKIQNGKLIELPFGTNTSVSPQAISDTGVIVGNYLLPDPNTPGVVESHGFVLGNNLFTDFMFPGATSGTANDINASGMIVGDFGSPNGPGHYIYSSGKFFTVKLPGASGVLSGINGFGEITGFIFQNTAPFSRGFVGRCTLP
ncbi:MAG TPA: hypothetical protein VFI72_12805 [Candidatus Angelobacter sp.]|nr:hypothetical protein [Candidatus Angelobacter sp.]